MFDLIHEQKAYNATISEYQTSCNGLRVVFVQVERPLLSAIFLVPTEAKNNLGCAHALEHLVFFGGKNYPYRGFLDALASRSLAESTNAWTATDHTAYTITTAGYEGFMNIFPVYLDHIMHPSFSEDSLLTEIHYINEKGGSEGVVYSELETSEYQCSEVVEREMRRQLYGAKCGYRYDAGGRLSEIKKINTQLLHAFHQKFYRYNNLSIVLIGMIPIPTFLEALSTYLQQEDTEPLDLKSPWTDSVPVPPVIPKPITVNFPMISDTDEACDVKLGWRGPSWNNFRERLIIEIVGHYLSASPASPLESAFVNIKYPYCSCVHFSEETFRETYYTMTFSNVKIRNLNKIKRKFLQILEELHKTALDIEQIRATITLVLTLYEHELQECPEEGYGDTIVAYLVNSCGKPDSTVFNNLWTQEQTLQNDLINKSADFWCEQIAKYFLYLPSVEIRGVPCSNLTTQLLKDKKKTWQSQKTWVNSLGHGEKYHQKVEKAKNNTVEIPETILNSFSTPAFSHVKTYQLSCSKNFEDDQQSTDAQDTLPTLSFLNSLPFAANFCSAPSQFLETRLVFRFQTEDDLFDPSRDYLTHEEVSLLPMFCELLFSSDVSTNHLETLLPASAPKTLTHEEYTNLLVFHLMEQKCFLGISGESAGVTTFPELLTLYFCARKTNLVALGEIILTTLNDTIFTETRIESLSRSLFAHLLRRKRKASTIAAASLIAMRYKANSVRVNVSILKQQYMLRLIAKSSKTYVPKFQELYRKLFSCLHHVDPPMVLHLVGSPSDVLNNKKFQFLLKKISKQCNEKSHFKFKGLPEILKIPSNSSQRSSENASQVFGKMIILESLATAGSLVSLSFPGTNHSFTPNVVNLLALSELFSNGDAGPLFNAVRSSGSAYGATLDPDFSSKEIFLTLQNCSRPAQALSVALEVFEKYLRKEELFIPTLTNNSKCSVFLRLIRAQDNFSDYALERFQNLCLGLPESYSDLMIQQLDNVSPTSLRKTMRTFFSKFFPLIAPNGEQQPDTLCLIVTPPDEQKLLVRKEFIDYLNTKFSLKLQAKAQDLILNTSWEKLLAWAVTGDCCDGQKVEYEDLNYEISSNRSNTDSDGTNEHECHRKYR